MNKKAYIFITNKDQRGMIENALRRENLKDFANIIMASDKEPLPLLRNSPLIFLSKQVKLYHMEYVNKVVLPFLAGKQSGKLFFFTNVDEILKIIKKEIKI